jgi:hypothetical protein
LTTWLLRPLLWFAILIRKRLWLMKLCSF